MTIQTIASKEDVTKVLEAIHDLKEKLVAPRVERKFLRSADVREMLSISDGTLQRLRISKELKAKKVNGTWFYKMEDVIKMMEVDYAKKY